MPKQNKTSKDRNFTQCLNVEQKKPAKTFRVFFGLQLVGADHFNIQRLGRLPGTPYSIAAGFACGATVSFTPLVGLHFFLVLSERKLGKCNRCYRVAVGIHGHFFIWMWLHKLGNWMGAIIPVLFRRN